MGAAVALAGSLAGGLAGNALAKKFAPNPIGVDTNIPGVSKAVIQKGGKNNKEQSVAQVDPSGALGYFKQAAEQNQQYVAQGLDLYKGSIQSAVKEINDSYTKANNTIRPAAMSGMAALNKSLQMMGIDPVSSTQGYGNQLRSLGSGMDGTAQLLDKLETTTDPAQRAALNKQINQQLSGAANPYTAKLQQTQKELGALGAAPTMESMGFQKNSFGFPGGESISTYLNADKASYEKALQEYNTRKAQLEGELSSTQAQADEYGASLKDYQTQFNQNYTAEQGKGYTGEEVTRQLEATPGYQFQMKQGLQGVARNAQAGGMLGSGNIVAASNDYAQGQANSFYNTYMNNLNQASGQGLPFLSQLSQNQVGQGANLASLYTMLGSAGASAYNQIGQGYLTAGMNAGNSQMQANMYNAQSQNAAIEANKDREASLQQQALASGPSYMNAQTAQQQQAYSIFQNQQGGQAYFANQKQQGYF